MGPNCRVCPICGGRACRGKEGIRLCNEKILSEWKNAMLMTGCTTLGDITPDKIRLTN